jgi:putative GTP diphosphokinase
MKCKFAIKEITMEIQMWKEILTPYDLAVEELQIKFNHIVKEYRQAGVYSPIEQVLGRVKSISSIIQKAQRRDIPIDKIQKNILDIAGIRIICQFTEDIYTVVKLIKKRKDMTVISEKDYIRNIKESGYRSYHIIVHYEVETVKGTSVIPVEIQIRTLGMNFWAIIEHSLQYKYDGEIPLHVRERLNAASDALITLDNEMSSIHDEIINSQTYFMVKANIVSDILSTIQNLYKVANKQVVIKIQDEFYEIFEKGDVNELSRFSRQLDIIAEDYRAQSVQ